MISVIIPTLNEHLHLQRCLAALSGQAPHECLVVDGSSEDDTQQTAMRMGAAVLVSATRHRATQMNLGARHARGDILVFLHADTVLPVNALARITAMLARNPRVVGGCFSMALDHPPLLYRIIARGGDLYCRLTQTLFGDRVIFVRRHAFALLGGFRELPIMEDVDLGRRLRKQGRLRMLSGPVISSARRFARVGPLKLLGRILLACIAFDCGVSREWIARMYSGRPANERATPTEFPRSLPRS